MGNTDKFERVAKTYDTPERIETANVSAEAIRRHVVDAKGKRAVDFGCGTGLVGIRLIDEFDSMLFVDASPGMIRQVERKIADRALRQAAALCVDLEKERAPGLQADYIFMSQVLLHIPDAEAVLSALFDVLNEGGHLLIVDFDKNENIASDLVHNGFDQAELAAVMTRIGYRAIRSETFHSGSRLFMGHDATMFILDSRKDTNVPPSLRHDS